MYCNQLKKKIGDHLQKKHKNEEEVKALSTLSSKDKAIQLDKLRCKGDFYHNIKVLKTGGELIIWRRPDKDDVANVEDYIPCKFCLAFITKSEMWRHAEVCRLKSSESKDLIEHSNLIMYPNRYASGASRELKLILDSMNNDAISKIVHNDKIICTYGSFMLASSGIKRAHSISQRMRILARLLLKLHGNLNEDNDLSYYIKPQYFDTIKLPNYQTTWRFFHID